MINKPLTTPVLFLIFNRPDTTQRVFDKIKKVKPTKFFVAADGPRDDMTGEAERCQATRDVIKEIDWECEVHTNFREKNLGLKLAVSSAVDWFFSIVEEGIILEDDCLPHTTFFHFCEELLERYRNDDRIAQISGNNFQFGRKRTAYSYYFSRYTHIWGWASWRRAWKKYDVNMKLWPEIRNGKWLHDWLRDKNATRYWTKIFDNVYKGEIDSWDYGWTFTCWVQGALTVLPNVNIVSNIGFGGKATHTKRQSKFACMKTEPMAFPLLHPPFVLQNSVADTYTERNNFSITLPLRMIVKLKHLVGKFFKLIIVFMKL